MGDGFVVKLNPAGCAILYGTLFGGNGSDSPVAIALDARRESFWEG